MSPTLDPGVLPPPPRFPEAESIRSMPSAELFNRPVKPSANLAALIENEDYPIDAIRNGEEGIVGFILKVNEVGRVADCLVEYTSGSSSLDVQTCRLMWLRARFEPARDQSGKPVTGAIRARIRWVFPEAGPTPIMAWSSRVILTIAKGGGIVSCKMQGSGALNIDQDDCRFWSYLPSGFLAPLVATSVTDVSTVFMDSRFLPGETKDQITAGPKGELMMRQVARVTIDPMGNVSQCRIVETGGTMSGMPNIPDGCAELKAWIFEKPTTESRLPTSIDATIVRELSRRR